MAYHFDIQEPSPSLEVIASVRLVKEVLNHSEQGSDRLISHRTCIVARLRELGCGLGHVVGYHIESWAEGIGYMPKFDVMSKHVHAHVDMPSCRLVGRMQAYGDGTLIVNVGVGRMWITETEVLQ